MIHLANVGDFDKISKKSLNDRIDWVYANEDMILGVANDFKATFATWSTADYPMQFLAACIEYKKMKEQGDNYECSLFCSLDGTNSGTQHLALASKDAKDGKNKGGPVKAEKTSGWAAVKKGHSLAGTAAAEAPRTRAPGTRPPCC